MEKPPSKIIRAQLPEPRSKNPVNNKPINNINPLVNRNEGRATKPPNVLTRSKITNVACLPESTLPNSRDRQVPFNPYNLPVPSGENQIAQNQNQDPNYGIINQDQLARSTFQPPPPLTNTYGQEKCRERLICVRVGPGNPNFPGNCGQQRSNVYDPSFGQQPTTQQDENRADPPPEVWTLMQPRPENTNNDGVNNCQDQIYGAPVLGSNGQGRRPQEAYLDPRYANYGNQNVPIPTQNPPYGSCFPIPGTTWAPQNYGNTQVQQRRGIQLAPLLSPPCNEPLPRYTMPQPPPEQVDDDDDDVESEPDQSSMQDEKGSQRNSLGLQQGPLQQSTLTPALANQLEALARSCIPGIQALQCLLSAAAPRAQQQSQIAGPGPQSFGFGPLLGSNPNGWDINQTTGFGGDPGGQDPPFPFPSFKTGKEARGPTENYLQKQGLLVGTCEEGFGCGPQLPTSMYRTPEGMMQNRTMPVKIRRSPYQNPVKAGRPDKRGNNTNNMLPKGYGSPDYSENQESQQGNPCCCCCCCCCNKGPRKTNCCNNTNPCRCKYCSRKLTGVKSKCFNANELYSQLQRLNGEKKSTISCCCKPRRCYNGQQQQLEKLRKAICKMNRRNVDCGCLEIRGTNLNCCFPSVTKLDSKRELKIPGQGLFNEKELCIMKQLCLDSKLRRTTTTLTEEDPISNACRESRDLRRDSRRDSSYVKEKEPSTREAASNCYCEALLLNCLCPSARPPELLINNGNDTNNKCCCNKSRKISTTNHNKYDLPLRSVSNSLAGGNEENGNRNSTQTSKDLDSTSMSTQTAQDNSTQQNANQEQGGQATLAPTIRPNSNYNNGVQKGEGQWAQSQKLLSCMKPTMGIAYPIKTAFKPEC